MIRRPHLHQPMMFLATAFGFLLLSSPMLASTLSEGCLLLRLASLSAMYLALSMTSLCRYEPHQWQGNRFFVGVRVPVGTLTDLSATPWSG